MADPITPLILDEIRIAIQEKEHDLSELDLLLTDYHTERLQLIHELRRLQAQLRDSEEAAIPASERKPVSNFC